MVVDGYLGTVGVVSPYRAQANRIRELCHADEELARLLSRAEFISDTVHRFQGDERDIIVFSPVISGNTEPRSLMFLSKNGNLFNVAITRARAMLLVIGNKDYCRDCSVSYLSEFARHVDSIGNQDSEEKQEVILEYGEKYPAAIDMSVVSEWEVNLYEALYRAGIRTIPQYRIEQYSLDLALIEGERRLDIEVDGEMYHRNWNGELCRKDQIRNQRMYELGWDVQRFWVYEIRDSLDQCVNRIKQWQSQGDMQDS